MKITIEISRKKLLAIAAVLCVVSAALITRAVIQYTTSINNTSQISDDGVILWSNAAGAAVYSIPWGRVCLGQIITSDQVFGFNQQLFVKNQADISLYAGWHLNTTLPPGVSLTADYFDTVNNYWTTWHQDTYSQFNIVPSGGLSNAIRFDLTISTDANVTMGQIVDFQILLFGATTQQG